MNDASIINLLFKRDEAALVELKNKYENLLVKVSGNILSSQEDVEECVNSTYLAVWNSIPPEKPSNLCAYICKIVKRHSLNKLKFLSADKRNVNITESLSELEDCLSNSENIEDIISGKELTVAINRFLHSQNQLDCNLFVKRYWYSDSIEDIATFYNLNSKTIATRLFRTRKRLKKYLVKEGLINE